MLETLVKGKASKYSALFMVILLVIQLCIPQNKVYAETTKDDFQARTFSNPAKYTYSMPYRLFVPANYNPQKSYPLVLFLHGAGERGTDNTLQIQEGCTIWAEPANQAENPCFIIAPQCPPNEQWVDTDWSLGSYSITNVPISEPMQMVLDIVSSVRSEFNIDATRMYSTGLSMGGYGTWDINLRNPGMFAAMLPNCGAADPSKASLISSKPIWAFHGALDDVVPVSGSRDMIAALQAAGGNPKYTEYPDVYHNAWDYAYAEPDIVAWTMSKQLNHTNVAAGKAVTSNLTLDNATNATNSNTLTTSYADGRTGAQWAQVDFGDSYNIDRVNLWHYFADARTYHDVIVQLSNDPSFTTGVTTVFNNDTDNSCGQGIGTAAEYTESNIGKRITFNPVSARYIRTWINGNNANDYNHWVEIEAWANTTTLPSGQLVGSNSEGGTTDGCGTDLSMAKYIASSSGNATKIQIKIAANVASGKKVKAAIYSDNSGSPGSFLKGTNELTAPTAGWQELTLTSTQSITNGTAYWLVVWSDDPNFQMKADSESGNGRYKGTTYSSTWPTATGMSTNNVKYCMYATDTGTTPSQLIGSNTSGSTYDGVGSDLSMAKFTASANGTATKIKVKLNNACTAGKKVKVAIYADNAGAPGAVLKGSNELTAPAAGWQEFTLTSSQSITAGTTYWLAVWSDDTNHLEISCDTQTGISRYKTLTYGTWPNNPTGMINGDNKYCIYAY